MKNEKNEKNMGKTRANESETEAQKRKEKNAEAMKKTRANESETESQRRKDTISEAHIKAKTTETEDEAQKRKEKHAKAMKKCRKMPRNPYAARNCRQTLYCEQLVSELGDTSENIGSMNCPCLFCGALKWKREKGTLCCKDGKVKLESFSDPPQYLANLWTSDTATGRIFRENARSFNNALALSSVKVVHRNFGEDWDVF